MLRATSLPCGHRTNTTSTPLLTAGGACPPPALNPEPVAPLSIRSVFYNSIIQFFLICPTSALEKNFNPQNMLYIHPVKNCFRLRARALALNFAPSIISSKSKMAYQFKFRIAVIKRNNLHFIKISYIYNCFVVS
jgi:hypothetical protein